MSKFRIKGISRMTSTRATRGREMARLEGVEGVQAALRKRTQMHLAGMRFGVKQAGEYLIRKSLDIVPIEEGDLYRSAFVEVDNSKLARTEAEIGYKDEKATVVHEMPYAHGWQYNLKYMADIAAGRKRLKRDPEQNKFLEKPMRENRKYMLEIIRRSMRKAGRL